MKRSLTRVAAAVTFGAALVAGQAPAQINRDRKPPGDLSTPVQGGTAADSVPRPKSNKDLLGGLVISRLDAVRDSRKNAITVTGVVANTSPFRMERVTWTFSRWNGREWAEISSSGPGPIESKKSLTTACATAATRDALKVKLEVRAATAGGSTTKEYTLAALRDHPYHTRTTTPPTRAQRDEQLPGGVNTLFAWPNVVKFAAAKVGQKGLGDGQCTRLVEAALAAAGAKPGSNYVWGTPQKAGQRILPGYVIQFRSCVFRDNATGSESHLGVPNHTAIVEKAGGTRVTLLHQNVDGEPAKEKSYVRRQELDLGWLVSGTYTVYSPVVR